MTDDIDYAQVAADQEFARAYLAGEVELVYDDTAPVPDLPPPGAPVNVIRPLRIPHDLDVEVRELAEQRGVTISVMLRELIVAGLGVVSDASPDPVTELRHIQAAAQRALEGLATRRLGDAA